MKAERVPARFRLSCLPRHNPLETFADKPVAGQDLLYRKVPRCSISKFYFRTGFYGAATPGDSSAPAVSDFDGFPIRPYAGQRC